MPYPGVPASQTEKMERCVKDVMKQGHDKSSAIAICHTSIVKESVKKFVDGFLKEMTSTGDIAVVPMGMKAKAEPEDDVDALDKLAKVKEAVEPNDKCQCDDREHNHGKPDPEHRRAPAVCGKPATTPDFLRGGPTLCDKCKP